MTGATALVPRLAALACAGALVVSGCGRYGNRGDPGNTFRWDWVL